MKLRQKNQSKKKLKRTYFKMAVTKVGSLLVNATTVGVGETKTPTGTNRTYFFTAVADAGANASASIDIEVSLDNVNFIDIGTVDFTNVNDTKESDSFGSVFAYKYLRANVKSISGSGMTINVTYGVNQ